MSGFQHDFQRSICVHSKSGIVPATVQLLWNTIHGKTPILQKDNANDHSKASFSTPSPFPPEEA